MFINKTLYTDVQSWKVLSVNGNKAVIVEVKKNPVNLEVIPHGFAWHCPNQREAYDNSSDIEEVGSPFEVVFKNGVWGRWVPECRSFNVHKEEAKRLSELEPERYEILKDFGECCLLLIRDLTPSGKQKKYFSKYGVMEEECRYFYDHNF